MRDGGPRELNWSLAFSRRSLFVVFGAAAVTAAGCSGAAPVAPATPTVPARRLDPDDFAKEVDGGQRFVLNVHTPDEGSIEGTDESIPFDELNVRAAELPAAPDTPLAVYCRTGGMSEVAVVTLAKMGFTDVVELRDGMVAWVDAGHVLLDPAPGLQG